MLKVKVDRFSKLINLKRICKADLRAVSAEEMRTKKRKKRLKI